MNPFYKNMALWLVICLMMVGLFHYINQQRPFEKPEDYSQFLNMVDEGHVASVNIVGQDISFKDTKGRSYHTFAPKDDALISTLRANGVQIKSEPETHSPWFAMLINWLPMFVLIGLWVFFMRQMQSGGGKAMSFGKSRARLLGDQQARVTFEDVAGVDEAKEELSEVVEFLKDPKKYTRLGGRIPKGVLLMGPPGSGKTLLARAIAGEAEVPFFTISGSDFVEMFVGVGASRVRDLFAQGLKNAPCIIFIDEIDAVGRHRGAGLGGGHDEREQTLNQLLVEMDGFESNEGVILISATNRPDVLDPALLRPGRFDRQVMVPLPDLAGRQKILEVHMRKTPVGDGVDTTVLAKGTAGFSGADLENLVNEAALLAAKRGKEKLQMVDFEDAKDKVYMGLERKTKVQREEELKNTAIHEGGHALVARFLPDTDAVNKITIIPRGRALGLTWFLPEERDTYYRDWLEHQLAIGLGGRAAEELVFNRMSTGASNDIKQATETAQKMVREWGMSDSVGPLSYGHADDQIFLGREISRPRDYSEQTAKMIDQEVHRLVTQGLDLARKILQDNVDILNKLADLLLDKETILGADMDALIFSMRTPDQLPDHLKKDQGKAREKPMEAPVATETEETAGDSEDQAPEADLTPKTEKDPGDEE